MPFSSLPLLAWLYPGMSGQMMNDCGRARCLLAEGCRQDVVLRGTGGTKGREFSLCTNQCALGEVIRRAYTRAQLGEEQEGEDEYLHGEDVLVVSMMAGGSCLCSVEISGKFTRSVAIER